MEFKEKQSVDLMCGTCGKPVSSKARTDVTRYLSFESRCMCSESEAPPETGSANGSTIKRIFVARPDPNDLEWVQNNLGQDYEVIALLGQGGMGCVYKVVDKRSQQTFAVKILYPDLVAEATARARFEQEARSASSLTHANLAAVYGFGQGSQGSPFIVMDYLDGRSLADLIKQKGNLDVPTALDIFTQVAEAMTHAHMKGLIHRDIKPANIIIIPGENDVNLVKIVDFGIAKVMAAADMTSPNLTQTGDVFGSPAYMSPEQCLGEELDARSDVYSFGCVMYEALTGAPPFAGYNMIKTVLKHVQEVPPAVSGKLTDYQIPPALEQIVMCCLEKSPSDRYSSMSEVLFDLESVRHGTPLRYKPDGSRNAKTPSTYSLTYTKEELRRKLYRVFAAAAGVVIFVGVYSFWMGMHSHPSTSEPIVPVEPEAARPKAEAPLERNPVNQMSPLSAVMDAPRQSTSAMPRAFWYSTYSAPNSWKAWTFAFGNKWVEKEPNGKVTEYQTIKRSIENGFGPNPQKEQMGTIVRGPDSEIFFPDYSQGEFVATRPLNGGRWKTAGPISFSAPAPSNVASTKH